MNPIRTLWDAVALPFRAVFVVGLCLAINWFTTPGQWWVQWVALGMGIAVLCAWGRALKLVTMGAVLALLGNWAYRRWGEDGRRRVHDWLQAPPPAS